ncbi:MAG: hypothetical protein AUI15_24175 [Actinobacteria bacterium 13_2_20CM_2_66_6]|nr:MAG: hypothetical protein AUI15_24175 [Actinobacteria bacterium 13_2_20CM_2_66_6]
MALVSAANDMAIVPMPIQTPVRDGCGGGGSAVVRAGAGAAVGGPARGGEGAIPAIRRLKPRPRARGTPA